MTCVGSCWHSALKISGSCCTLHCPYILLIHLTFWAEWDCVCKVSLWGESFLSFFSDWELRVAYNVEVGNEILRQRSQRTGNTLIFWFFSNANLLSLFYFQVFWIISVKFGEVWILLPKDINCIYRYKNSLSSLSLLVEYPDKK